MYNVTHTAECTLGVKLQHGEATQWTYLPVRLHQIRRSKLILVREILGVNLLSPKTLAFLPRPHMCFFPSIVNIVLVPIHRQNNAFIIHVLHLCFRAPTLLHQNGWGMSSGRGCSAWAHAGHSIEAEPRGLPCL